MAAKRTAVPAQDSQVLSMRLLRSQIQKLRRHARVFGISPAQAAARLLEEKLREEDFPSIDFRTTNVGRLAFVKGHRLAVWQVALLATDYGSKPETMARALKLPTHVIAEALEYVRAYPDEIDPLVEEAQTATPEDLQTRLPWLQRFPA